MGLYYKILLAVTLLVGTFGFLGPKLISYKSTSLVILGFVLILVILPPVMWKLGRSIYYDVKARFEPTEDTEETTENEA